MAVMAQVYTGCVLVQVTATPYLCGYDHILLFLVGCCVVCLGTWQWGRHCLRGGTWACAVGHARQGYPDRVCNGCARF